MTFCDLQCHLPTNLRHFVIVVPPFNRFPAVGLTTEWFNTWDVNSRGGDKRHAEACVPELLLEVYNYTHWQIPRYSTFVLFVLQGLQGFSERPLGGAPQGMNYTRWKIGCNRTTHIEGKKLHEQRGLHTAVSSYVRPTLFECYLTLNAVSRTPTSV